MNEIETIIYAVGILTAVIFFGIYLYICIKEDKKKEIKKDKQYEEIKKILEEIKNEIK